MIQLAAIPAGQHNHSRDAGEIGVFMVCSSKANRA